MPDIYSMLFYGKKCDLDTLIRKVPEIHSAFLQKFQNPEDPIEILALTWMGATSDSQQYVQIKSTILHRPGQSHLFQKALRSFRLSLGNFHRFFQKLFQRLYQRFFPRGFPKNFPQIVNSPLNLKIQIITGLDGTLGIFFGLPIAKCVLEESWKFTTLKLLPRPKQRKIIRSFSQRGLGRPEYYLLEVME
ncbi:MAG: hypothetical protein ACTSRK_07980 [Promethearchaeota archaeon]